MARNLLASGFDVRVWNRTSSKAQRLAAHGAHVADTPADAAHGAEVLITMLLDTETTVRAAAPAYRALDDGGVWLQMGTIGLSGMREVARIADSGSLVDAPVLGTRKPAEQATLVALAAGAPAVRERVAPMLDAMTERTLWLGEDPAGAAGTRLKLVANNWVLALTNAVGESIALARHLGTDPQRFLEAIGGTATDSPYAQLKGGAIIGADFTPSFTASGAAKDADLTAEAGEGLRLDLAEGARQRLRRAVAAGHGDEDMAAAYFSSFE